MASCKDCKFSGDHGFIQIGGEWTPTEGLGCRLNPPIAIVEYVQGVPADVVWQIPPVPDDYWCGQYKPKSGTL